jgi:hypothetical protein
MKDLKTVNWEIIGVGSCVSSGESAARTSWVLDTMVKKLRTLGFKL